MFISFHAKNKTFGKIQYTFIIKPFNNEGVKGNIFDFIKERYLQKNLQLASYLMTKD